MNFSLRELVFENLLAINIYNNLFRMKSLDLSLITTNNQPYVWDL